MVAVPLIFGDLLTEHYEDRFHAAHLLIDALHDKMEVVENQCYSADYHDPGKRSIVNAIQVFFRNGSKTDNIAVEYPLGHCRRAEGIPVLEQKFRSNLATRFVPARADRIFTLCKDQQGGRHGRQRVHGSVRDLIAALVRGWRCARAVIQ